MTKYKKNNKGEYVIKGKTYKMLVGERASVYHGNAYKTSGDLTKNDLIKNKNGRIVSKDKHNTAKKEKRLIKAGYGTRKGHFGAIRLNGHSKSKSKSRRQHRRKQRGGGGSISNVEAYNSGGVPSAAFSSQPERL